MLKISRLFSHFSKGVLYDEGHAVDPMAPQTGEL